MGNFKILVNPVLCTCINLTESKADRTTSMPKSVLCIFCGKNSLQIKFIRLILVGENKTTEDAKEVFSAYKNSIEIHKEKDMFYKCET